MSSRLQTAEYSRTSAWFTTTTYGKFLDVMAYRDIPAYADDVQYTIAKTYEYRPDLLAFDLYGDAALWWVFAIRNPNVLVNPLNDFRSGQIILLPKKETLAKALGL